MNKVWLLVIGVLFACCVAIAAETQHFAYVAERVAVDHSSEEVRVTGMKLELGKHAQLNAESASHRIGVRPVPHVVELEGVQIKAGDQVVASAEAAVFYPDLRTLTTDAYHVNRARAPIGHNNLSMGDGPSMTTYECRNGTLYENDVPIGTSTCVNLYYGGSHTLSCTEGGNMVKVEYHDQACPVS